MATPKPGSGQRYKYDGNDKAVKDAVDAANQRLAASDAKLLRGVQALNDAYQRGAGLIRGYVTAGLAGTTMGEALARNFSFLNREVAQLFLPAIQKVNEVLTRTVQWFRNLSGAQQEAIGKWALIGVWALGFLTVLPKVTAGLKAMQATFTGIAASNPLLLAIAGMGALLASTEAGRTTLFGLGQTLLDAFAPLAEFLASVLVPAVETLAGFMDTFLGKVAFFGTLVAAVVPRLVMGIYSVGAAIYATLGPIGLAVAAVGALLAIFNALGRKKDEITEKTLADVRRGRISAEDAKRQERERIEDRLEGERANLNPNVRDAPVVAGMFRRRRGELTAASDARFDAAGKGRNELVPARQGKEDITATIQRMQDSLSKGDVLTTVAENTGAAIPLLARMGEAVREMAERMSRGSDSRVVRE